MKNLTSYIESLVKNSGPEPNEYERLNKWFQSVGELVRDAKITRTQVREIWPVFGEAFTVNTLQGFVVNKPYGYAGDFEIIDKIYTEWTSPEKHLMKWDEFFHWQKATIAVRNRKVYFKQLLSDLDSMPSPSTILNVGSGSCRDIQEYLDEAILTKISFECLDMDENAINYANRLLKSVFLKGAKINFFCQNAFKFQPNKEYDLVWSAGLFDYLDDNQFIFLLRSLLKMVRHNKEVIIGNFSDTNPSKDYMEFGEWFLHHRNEDSLRILAEKSGCNLKSVSIEKELSGVNLFLRVRKS